MLYSETTLSDGRTIRYVYDEINGDVMFEVDELDEEEKVEDGED